jgi:UDP:flavonoid glycosyltransferase YjiC (YdhE family)
MIDGVLAVGRAWAPDLIVFEPLSYAGPLAAAALGIPAVRHTWGIDYTYFQREFEPEALGPLCERLGIPDVETFGLATVDPCLPVLQVPLLDEVPVIPRRLPMRYVPYNGSRPTPRWLRAPVRRPRICVTWGTSSGKWDDRFVLTGRVVRALAGLDAEIVAAVSPRDLHLVDLPDTDNVRLAEYTPFNVLFPTCDLVISQGGLGTVMTALSAGVPHLILPAMADTVLNARQLAATGAGDFLFPVEAEQDDIREITERMLGTASYADAARELQAANAALPTPGVLVESVRDLLAG